MPHDAEEYLKSVEEVRQARAQAQLLRDLLAAEHERLVEAGESDEGERGSRFRQGLETMGRAVAAADRAIANMDQALRELERIPDEPPADPLA
jgi:hypothetical protein